MADFNSLGALGRVLRAMSSKPDLYKHGAASPIGFTPEQVAARYGLLSKTETGSSPLKTISLYHPKGGEGSISIYPNRGEWVNEVGEQWKTDADAQSMLDAMRERGLISDINTISANGAGSNLYRAMYDINRLEGAQNATGMLTSGNRSRRTENMLSAGMHDPDFGKRILVDPRQALSVDTNVGVGQLSPLQFASMDRNAQLGVLADNAARNVDKASGYIADHRAVSFKNPLSSELDRAYEEAPSIVRAAAPAEDDIFDGRLVGESTARRALLNRGVLNALRSGMDERKVIDSIMDLDHSYFKHLYYKEGGGVDLHN